MVDEQGRFIWALPFWQQPIAPWTHMIDAGVRAAFVASQHAARTMTARRRGLIVNISTCGGGSGRVRHRRSIAASSDAGGRLSGRLLSAGGNL